MYAIPAGIVVTIIIYSCYSQFDSQFYLLNLDVSRVGITAWYLYLLLILFSGLGIIASDFLCPNLIQVSNYLDMSEKTVGMTLLAFGNGAPDIVSTFIAMNSDSTGLALGELIGSAFFVTTIVIGLMGVICPFKVGKFEFSRDIVTFLIFVSVCFWFLQDGVLNLSECLIMVGIYLGYLGFLIVGEIKEKNTSAAENARYSIFDILQVATARTEPRQTDMSKDSPENSPLIASPSIGVTVNYNSINHLPTPPPLSPVLSSTDTCLENWKTLLFPSLVQLSKENSFSTNYLLVANAITYFSAVLTIPTLRDYKKSMYKNLLLVQAALAPSLVGVLVFTSWSSRQAIIIALSSLASLVVVYFVSIPKLAVSGIGFSLSIFWISNIARVIIFMLREIGVILDISDSLLGLTLFAFGNSVGDLVSNITFAKLGSALTGLGACFGSPLLYILLGVGLNGTIMIAKTGHSIEFEISHSLVISSLGFLITIVFLMAMVPLNRWYIDKKIGTCLICWWVAVTGYNIIFELS